MDGVQSQISRELKVQLKNEFKKFQKNKTYIIVLVVEVQVMVFGMNLWIMIKNNVEFIGVEAGGPKKVKTSCSTIN